MNDEIKEIFDTKLYFDLEEDEYIKIKDYITNLQQENDDLKNRLENAVADCNLRLQENERLKEWKEDLLKENIELENIRKEAIEYIENPRHEMSVLTYHNLLNILQNGGDSQ